MTHFDHVANEWDTPQKVRTISLTAQKIKENITLSSDLSILDFGCGTGLLAAEFLDQSKEILGIDTSQGMLDVFNQKFQKIKSISSLNINLEEQDLDRKFDLIISSMVFHHLDRPDKALKKLIKLLNKNGVIAIVDLDKEDGSFHPDNDAMGVKHFGFSKEILSSWAKDTNLKLDHKLVHHIEKNDRNYNLFLAAFSLS